MADPTDTDQQPPATAQSAPTFQDYIARMLQQLQQPQPIQAPPRAPGPQAEPTSWVQALGRGMTRNAPYPVSPDEEESVGLAGLLSLGGGLGAVGGAGRAEAAQQAGLLQLQREQQQQELARLQAALPLLTMQQRLNMPSLYGGGGGQGAPGAPGTPPGGPGSGVADLTGDWAHDAPLIAKRESGGDPNALNYVARSDPSAYARGATASGKYQIVNSTWAEGMRLAGLDPTKYPTAMSAPEDVQDTVAKAIYGKYGTKPWDPTQWKQNWVPTPTGQFILAGRATPTTQPAAGPPGAYKVAGPVVAPPAVTPGGPPATATTAAPSLPVPPLPPPEGIPIGDQGLRRMPDGSVVTPGGGGLGKGVQVAGPGGPAAAPPGAIPAAPAPRGGPAPASAVTPPATVAPSEVGPVTGPLARVGPTVTPPAVPTAQPATMQPTPTPQPAVTTGPPASRALDYSVPDTALNPEEYQDRHFTPLTPEQVKTYAPGPTGEQAVTAAKKVQDAQNQLNAARTQLDQIRRGGMPGDPNKAMTDVQAAQNELDKNESEYNTAVQTLAQSGAKNLLDRDTAEHARVSADYKNMKDREAELAKITTTSDVQAGQKALEDVNNTRDAARDTYNSVEIAKNLSKLAGTSGFLQQWPQVSNFLVRNNLLSPQEVDQLGAQKSLDAVINKVILSMRQGSGISRMTNFDLQFLQNTAPSSFTPEQMRPAMFATIQSAANRQLQYADMVNELHASIDPQTNQPMAVWKAKELADQKLGPLVKTVPTVYPKDDPRAGQPMSYDDQGKWVLRNVDPGSFYVQPSGKLGIRGEAQPPQQGQQ